MFLLDLKRQEMMGFWDAVAISWTVLPKYTLFLDFTTHFSCKNGSVADYV